MNFAKISDIGKIVSGSTPKSNVKEFWGGDIPWVTPKELSDLNSPYITKTERTLTEEGYKSCSTTILPRNSILFTSRAPIGHVAINDIELCTNQGFKSIVLDQRKAYPLYLYYCLRHFKVELQDMGTGTTFMELSKQRFAEFQIPLPSLSDQIKIATLLKKTEDLIQKRKESIELVDELVRSTFLELFGDPVINQKRFPYMSLTEICDKITDGTHHSPPVIDQGIPYITAKHIKENFIDFESKPWYVSEEDHRDIYSRCDPKPNDILYIKDGATTGIAAINRYEFEFSMLSSVALLRVGNTCTPEFVLSWLNNPRLRENEIKGMSGAAIQRFTLSKIKEFKLFVPPLDLQNKYSGLFKKYEVIREQFIESKKELENLFNSLSQRAFNGELDLSKVEITDPELKKLIKNSNTKTATSEIKSSAEDPIKRKIDEQVEEFSNFSGEFIESLEVPKTVKEIAKEWILKTISRVGLEQTIKRLFQEHHFNSEILLHALEEEGINPQYTSSKEWKENLKVDPTMDIHEILFEAMNRDSSLEENQGVLRLEQFFYNAIEPVFPLKLRPQDKAFLQSKNVEEQSGVYYKVLA